MIDLPSLPVDAAWTVGLVLAESLALYVGYGAVTSVVEPRITDAIRNR